jgi:zinc transport system substrate-binding protein
VTFSTPDRDHDPRRLLILVTAIFFLLGSTDTARAEGPSVAVSLKPLHSLVSAVMQGVGEPELLFRTSASPHDVRLRPSQVRAVVRADLVVWIGQTMEASLGSTLNNRANDRSTLTINKIEGLKTLPARASGSWLPAAHAHGEHDNDHGNETLDPHVWLSTINAKVIVRAVADKLIKLDPANKTHYATNRMQVLADLEKLERDLRTDLKSVGKIPYVALHDAFQYFEHQFDLSPLGALSSAAGTSPGARRVSELRKGMARHKVHCIVSDPFARSAWIRSLGDGREVRVAALDPLGTGIKAGADHYVTMMRHNTAALASCLGMS